MLRWEDDWSVSFLTVDGDNGLTDRNQSPGIRCACTAPNRPAPLNGGHLSAEGTRRERGGDAPSGRVGAPPLETVGIRVPTVSLPHVSIVVWARPGESLVGPSESGAPAPFPPRVQRFVQQTTHDWVVWTVMCLTNTLCKSHISPAQRACRCTVLHLLA